MADTPDLGSGAERLGGSSPPSRRFFLMILLGVSTLFLFQCSKAHIAQPTIESLINQIQRENTQSEVYFSKKASLEREIYKEFLTQKTNHPLPVFRPPYCYYSRYEEGDKFPLYLRGYCNETMLTRGLSRVEGEEVILNPNQFFFDYPDAELGIMRISPKHDTIAFSAALNREQIFSLFVIHLETKSVDIVPLSNVHSFEWGKDSALLFVTTIGEGRPSRLYYFRPFNQHATVFLFEEKDKAFSLGLKKSESEEFVFLESGSISTNEVYWIDEAGLSLNVIYIRKPGIYYEVSHHAQNFIIRTNKEAPLFQLLFRPIESKDNSLSRIIIKPSPKTILEDIQVFENHLLLFQREEGIPRLSIYDFLSQKTFPVPIPKGPLTLKKSLILPYSSIRVWFHINSFLIPPTLYEYNKNSNLLRIIHSSFPPSFPQDLFKKYQTIQLVAPSYDGTPIPISLVMPRSLPENKVAPLLLHGYGAYGLSLDPSFSYERLSLLKRGVIYAIAHVRGGGEFGPPWHEGGRILNKKNSFMDFIACAEYLIQKGFTSPKYLISYGRSAGGLLVARSAQLRPDLFQGVIMEVPFLDVLTLMQNQDWVSTVREYEEWGNPSKPVEAKNILEYSPLSNMDFSSYPHTYLQASYKDMALPLWPILKWVELVRESQKDKALNLLSVSFSSTHEGERNLYDAQKNKAREHVFLLDVVGKER